MNRSSILRLLFILSISVFSCQKSENDVEVQRDKIISPNTVSIERAQKIASVQAPFASVQNGRVKGAGRGIKSTFTINPDKENPLMYVINYEEGGFVIISGDDRISPILAFSEHSQFKTDGDLPSGLLHWFSQVEKSVSEIRRVNAKQDPQIKRLWDRFNVYSVVQIEKSPSGRTSGTVYYDGDCNSTPSGYSQITNQDPLLQTVWSQGTGYNELLDDLNCPDTFNGRVWTGCVATAVAQIMKYHQFPSSYTWSSMPNLSGSAETSRLMRDLGTSTNLQMSYGCNASGAKTSRIPPTFVNFGYSSSVSTGNYDYYTVKSEVYSGYPVVLAGGTDTGWWIFDNYEDGHAWVCDGVREWVHYWCVSDPNTPGELMPQYAGYTDRFLSMNWGWGDDDLNGYFNAFNWTVDGGSYNYYQQMVTGIRKP